MKVRILLLFILLFITPTQILASEIVINEIMAKPSTGEKEWIEIYNPTSSSVDLTGWIIQEKTATTGAFNSYNLTGGLNPDSFYVYEFSSSKLNDDGDTINLLNPQGSLIDTYSYTEVIPNKAYARIPNGASWSSDVTPSKQSTNPTPTPTPSPTQSPTPAPSPTPASTPVPTTSTQPSQFAISDIPSQINSDQSFTIKISLSIPTSPGTDYYLKGAFKKIGGSRYFGLTKKDSEWIEYGDENVEQYKITTNSSGQWSGNVEIKPDIYDTDFKGSGDYTFKLGRLTSSSSQPIWSNEVNVKINQTEDKQTNNTEDTITTNIKTVTPSPSVKTTVIESIPKKSIILTDTKKTDIKIASIAGVSTSSARESSSPSAEIAQINKKGINIFLILGGILTLTGVTSLGFLLLKTRGLV